MNYKEFVKQWEDETLTFFELTTSGSTGIPKPIKLYKNHLIESANQTANALKLTNENILNCIPVNKVGGFMMRVRSIVLGFDYEEIKPVSNPMTQLQKDHDFTFISLVPMQIKAIVKDKISLDKLNRFSHVLLGGGPIDKGLLSEIEKLKHSIYHTYGMTETYSHIALKKLNNPNKQKHFECLPNVQVSINENSCLCIKTSFYTELIQTNDLATLNSDGTFDIIGRVDFVINSGGVKINPEKVEELISECKFLKSNFAISCVQDEEFGEKIVLVIESEILNHGNLLNELKEILPMYSAPKEIVYINVLPLTSTGKINRPMLKNLIKQIS